MGEFIARNIRADFKKINKKINKRKSCCILLVTYIIVPVMHGHTNVKFKNHKSLLQDYLTSSELKSLPWTPLQHASGKLNM